MNQSGWSKYLSKELCIYTGFIQLEDVLLWYHSHLDIYLKHNTHNKCLLWCLIAYLHPDKDHPNIVSNYNKPEYINE